MEQLELDNVERLRTDVLVAAETRAELTPLLAQVCAILDHARAAGLTVQFSVGLDQYGRHRVPEINVVKPL